MSYEPVFKTVHYEDGWVEIRETENPNGWLATDYPVWVEP